MPRLGPIGREELIFYLKRLGFEGPYSGGKHQFMVRGGSRLTIPNPHWKEIGIPLLSPFSGKQELKRANGKNYELKRRAQVRNPSRDPSASFLLIMRTDPHRNCGGACCPSRDPAWRESGFVAAVRRGGLGGSA